MKEEERLNKLEQMIVDRFLKEKGKYIHLINNDDISLI
jgi:hypothetical protein